MNPLQSSKSQKSLQKKPGTHEKINMDKELFIERVEKIIAKVNKLEYPFSNPETQQEMNQTIEEVVSLLEHYVYNVDEDEGELDD